VEKKAAWFRCLQFELVKTVMKLYTTTQYGMCRAVQAYFNNAVSDLKVTKYADGETLICLDSEPSAAESVVVLQAMAAPVNDSLVHTLFILETLRKACVNNVILIMTYLAYSRQDRQTCPLSVATASTVCRLLSFSNVSRAYVVEAHSPNITSFFSVPSFEISLSAVVCNHVSKTQNLQDVVVVALDQGGVSRASRVALTLGVPMISAVKYRSEDGVSVDFHNVEVSGKIGIIVDDIVDSGRSIASASAALTQSYGMKCVLAYCVHAATSETDASGVKVFVSNSTGKVVAAALDLNYVVSRLLKRVLALRCHRELL
ncbi:MAG: ribose-phosphate diphosphokinase, partial [Candidatus Hodgkinia cicadicola]